MKLKTMIIMLLCATCMYAQDLSSGLSVVNDLSNYPMQPISKPGYLQTITDPSFGTTIRRISNAPQGGIIKPMYSTIQAWNADESLMVLFERGRGHQLLDGMTYQFIRYLDDVRPDDIEQIFWDFDDPDIFYYVDRSNNNFVRYSVSNASGEVIVNLGTLVNCPNVSLGNDVQMMSWDSDIVGFRCGNDRVYYYRISTGQLTEFNLFDDNVRYTAPMPGASGNYFYHNRRIYNSSGNLHTNLNESNIEHSCNGRLANGDDGYFAVSFAQGPNGGCLGNLIQHNMRTGECTPLISEEQGYPYSKSGTHVSAVAHKNTQGGWVAASMVGFEEDGQSLLDQELVVARADAQGNVTVCRIGHHRADEQAPFDYWGEPHASISPTGTRVIFGSDWSGSADGQSVDTYIVELPSFGGITPPPPPPSSANAVTPGDIKIDPTFEHIGILYNISDDENLDSDLQIEFREQGNGAYRQGAVTMRSHDGLVIDGSTFNANHHAGSAMFLEPNTTYEIRLTLTDPDGGGTTQTVTARTKAYPVETSNYRYVAPGNGGGSGTSGNPYRGLQAAADNASPGTTFIVRPGNYSAFEFNTNGTASAPITFRSETLHAAIIDGANTSRGVITLGVFDETLEHIIIDGFQIQNGNWGIDAQNTQYLTVKNCRIEDVTWGFYNRRENGLEQDQYITNNYIEGRTNWLNGGTSHRAIDIRGNRNVISFNTIRNFDDAVSTDGAPYEVSYAMDIHNNDIQNMADDLIEVDGTVSNTRIYRNRMYNGRAGVSVAPVYGGPCYIFRNEMYNMRDGFSAYKMNRGPSGLVIVHNTSSKAGNGMSSPVGWQNTFFKNNVVIGGRYCFEEFGLVDGSIDDWDYNAYHSTRPGNNVLGQQWFKWDDDRYGNINELRSGTSIETNGIAFSLNTDIRNATPPADYRVEHTPDDTDFEPTNNSNFRNNGLQLDNLNDEYVTDGNPDRGAYEFGETLPKFGADFGITPPPPSSANAVTPGDIKIDPTFEHIGILYNISDDENLDSDLQIEFRRQGQSTFKKGAITMRSHPGLVIDGSTFNANHHAGSAMFLQPNKTYEIRLTLTDPDGGGTTTTVTAKTKAYPKESNNYKYVVPGNGGGNGTSSNPYRGLQAAADNAQPGTTYIVRKGNYSAFELNKNGTAGAPITFRSEAQHAAIIDGANTSRGVMTLGTFGEVLQHIIIDGFQIQNGNWGIDAQNTQYLTVKNCRIEDVTWGFYNRRENGLEQDQYITNNYIEGRTNWPNGGTSHRAIDIRGNRNVVSFNTIRNFDDAVSTDGPPYKVSYAMDIHNNDIQSMADDLIEVDGTVSNTRVYRNRIYNGRAGISLAPVYGGPCYVFRNEMYNMQNSAYKMNRGPSGLVIIHNTSSKAGNGMSSPVGWQNTFFKNNVVMGSRYCFEEFGLVEGSTDDWDYNAYKSTRSATPRNEWFKWDNDRYATIDDLRNGTSIEDNGIAINLGIIKAPPPSSYGTEYTPADTRFQPYRAADFVNKGINLDNLNDGFVYDGEPDMGCYEYANTLPKFGANFISSNKLEIGTINFNIFPNPFTHSFNIEYHLTQDEHVSIQLFTQEGKLVKTINNKVSKAAGGHTETVNIENLPSGMYLIHLTTSDSHGVQKLVKF